MLDSKRYCKFLSFNLIKLLSIKVKKVKKPRNNVIKNIITINKFFFRKLSIL